MKRLVTAVILGLAASHAMADEQTGGYAGIAATFADYKWDSDLVDDSSTGFKGYGGFRLNDWFGLEAAYHNFGDFSEDFDPLNAGGDADVKIDGFSVAALLYAPIGGDELDVYAKAGLFTFDQELEVDDAVTQSNSPDGVLLGAGVRLNVSDQFGVRAEGEWFDVDDADLWALNLGFEFLFGTRAPPPAPAPVVAAPVAPAPPADSDGDGVPDTADQCPGTTRGAPVDARGCELDSDKDGVVDRLDACPGTPEGAKVDARGCEQELILRGVNFETNSATLTTEDKVLLDSVAEILAKRPNFNVMVIGHTDNVGAETYNESLSQRRADSVLEYLVEKGIPEDQLTAVGRGESQPIASNETADGRLQNRRVTLEFSDRPGQ